MQEDFSFIRRRKGTGSILKAPKGGFCIRIPIGKTPSNNTRYKTVTGFATVAEATAALDAAMGLAPSTAETGKTENKTFSAWLEEYLDYKRSTVNSGDVGVRPIKQRTFDGLEGTANMYLFERVKTRHLKFQPTGNPLANQPINTITSQDVRDLLNRMEKAGLSRSSMKKTYDIINQVFRFANLSSPASFAFRANRSYRMNPPATFSKEDLAKIEKYLKDLERRQYSFGAAMALRFVMHTGCRVGEACGLRYEDYNAAAGTVTIRRNISFTRNNGYHSIETTPKSERSFRTLPLSHGAVDAVECGISLHPEIRQNNGYIFASRNGQPQDPTNLYRLLRSTMKQCGIEHIPGRGIHALRHTFVSSMIAKGVTAERIALYVGNDPMITARIYTHALSATDLRFISELDG